MALNIFKSCSYYRWNSFKNIKDNIKLFFRRFKWAYQRIIRGFCDMDTWDLDDYYTHLFVDSLKMYSKYMNGWPQSKEFPEFEDYKKYIDKMIYLFNQSIEGQEDMKQKFLINQIFLKI